MRLAVDLLLWAEVYSFTTQILLESNYLFYKTHSLGPFLLSILINLKRSAWMMLNIKNQITLDLTTQNQLLTTYSTTQNQYLQPDKTNFNTRFTCRITNNYSTYTCMKAQIYLVLQAWLAIIITVIRQLNVVLKPASTVTNTIDNTSFKSDNMHVIVL